MECSGLESCGSGAGRRGGAGRERRPDQRLEAMYGGHSRLSRRAVHADSSCQPDAEPHPLRRCRPGAARCCALGLGRFGARRNRDAKQSREVNHHMLTRLGSTANRWSMTTPWTNVYGVARSVLALATASTLAFSATGTLFRPAVGLPPAPYCLGPGRISLFCLVPHDRLSLARWLGVAILLVVASGWRPRVTAIFHWWVAFSLFVSITIPDGGDQATAVITLLLLPVALTDPRRWHWQS